MFARDPSNCDILDSSIEVKLYDIYNWRRANEAARKRWENKLVEMMQGHLDKFQCVGAKILKMLRNKLNIVGSTSAIIDIYTWQ